MNDDEMKRLWSGKKFDPPPGLPENELVARMKSKMGRFHHDIFWRDVREIAACVIVFAWAAYALGLFPQPLCRAGNMVLIFASVLIPWKMIAARRALPQVSGAAPTSDFLRGEIARVNEQVRLLNSVLWWYLLPVYVGIVLFQLGLSRSVLEVVGASLIIGAVFWFINRVNRYAVRKALLPLKQELEHVLDPENVPAPEKPYQPRGFALRIKLGNRTFEFSQECPMFLRFCIAMNAFWLMLPCLKSTDIPGPTIPGLVPIAIVVIIALAASLMAARSMPKSGHRLGKLLVLGILALSGLFALAWGLNILRVLLT